MNPIERERELTDEEYQLELDDLYGEVNVCGMTMRAGYVLREMDPTAFRCGKIDYTDSLEHEWECGECGEAFDNEEDAENCCA